MDICSLERLKLTAGNSILALIIGLILTYEVFRLGLALCRIAIEGG